MRQAEPLEKSAALYQKDLSTTTEYLLWRALLPARAMQMRAWATIDRSSQDS